MTVISPHFGASSSRRPGSAEIAPVRLRLRLPELIRAGVGTLLEPHASRLTILDDGDDGDDAVPPQVELFDPLTHGPDAQSARETGVPLVALVPDRTHAAEAHAMQLGAVRVLPHSVGAVELVSTLENVGRLGAAVGPDTVLRSLSPREAEILGHICRGRSNSDIADDLYLSINSVKTYIRLAYQKLGVTSRAQAVIWGLKHGL